MRIIQLSISKLNHLFSHKIARYALVGGTSTIIHIVAASLFIYLFNDSVIQSNISGFLTAYIFSYLMQSKLVFEHKVSIKKAAKYFIVQFAALLLAILISDVLSNYNSYIRTLLVAALLPLITFVIHKFWTFKESTRMNPNVSFHSSSTVKRDKFTFGLLVLICSFLMIIFTLSISIIFDKHLSADGAHYFVNILETQTFTYIDWTRQFANYISQILLVLAVNFGIKNLNLLSLIFGISLLLPYFLTFLLSFFALRGEDKSLMLFVLISMITINLTSDFVLIGEHHSLALLSWPILFFLLRKVPLVRWDVFFLFGLMFFYTRLYSTAVVPAVFFMFIAFLRVWYTPLISQKIYYFIAALIAIIAEGISLYSILYPRSPGNKEGFFQIILQSLFTPEVIVSILFLILFFMGWFFRYRFLILLSIFPIILFVVFVVYTNYAISAGVSFGNRSLVLTLLPLLLLMATVLHWKQKKSNKTLYAVFIGFVLVMLFSNILNTMQWKKFRNKTIDILQSHSGFISLKDTSIRHSRYRWSWTTPELSVIWSKGCIKTIILNADGIGWEPYDPIQHPILTQYVCYDDKLLFSDTSICKCYDNILTQKILFNSHRIIFNGWSHPENTHMWSLGKESKILFSAIKEDEKVQGLLSLNVSTLGEQEIKVTINGKYIDSQKVNLQNGNIQFKFNPKILNRDKHNTIEFEFPNAHQPNNTDTRVLAMALMSFKIE